MTPAEQYRFGRYRLDVDERELRRENEIVAITAKTFDLLVILVRGAGRTFTKSELLDSLWPETAVEENNLSQTVFMLRKALGESGADAQSGYIFTVRGRGYKFAGNVSRVDNGKNPVMPEEQAAPVQGRIPRWAWVAAAGVLLAAAAVVWYISRPKPGRPFQSLAVLPFENLSKDPGQDYVADGLTEEIIHALSPTPGLKVVARTSASQFRGKDIDIRDVGRQLGAEAILEGSIRVEGDRLRVTAQLNNSRDGYHYWSHSWDYVMKDVLAAQSAVAQAVVRAMGPGATLRQPKVLTQNLEAYDLYARGMRHRARIAMEFHQAVGALEDALKLDPGFAAAHAQIARALNTVPGVLVMGHSKAVAGAREHTAEALRLDPELALAHASSASIDFGVDWDFDGADRSFRRALELDPADTDVRHDYAHFLTAMGQFTEAMVQSRQLLELDPLGRDALAHMVWQNYYKGDLQGAVAAAQRALSVNPDHNLPHIFLTSVYEEMGDYRKAAAEIEMAKFRPSVSPKALAAYEKDGAAGYWRVRHDDVSSRAGDAESYFYLASYSARLDREGEALQWLEKAVANRRGVFFAVDPAFKRLRTNPRFQELVRRAGLPTSTGR